METAARNRVAVYDAGREECRRGNEEKPRREHHRPVGEAALNHRAGQAGIMRHVRSVLPLVSDAVTPPYTARGPSGSPSARMGDQRTWPAISGPRRPRGQSATTDP